MVLLNQDGRSPQDQDYAPKTTKKGSCSRLGFSMEVYVLCM